MAFNPMGILSPFDMAGGMLQQNPGQLLKDNYGPPQAPMAVNDAEMLDPQRAAYGAAIMNIGDIIGGRGPSQSVGGAYMSAKQSNDRTRQNKANDRRMEDARVRQEGLDELQRRNVESQIAARQAKANIGGDFAGTGIEAQMLNSYLNSLPPEQRDQAKADMVRQRLQRPTTIATPEGTYTRPGYQLPNPMQQPQPGQPQVQPPIQQPPAFTQKPLTGEQAKASGFYDRMIGAQGEIDDLMSKMPDFDPADTVETVSENVPLVGNMLISPERQRYRQAAKDWIRAKLRRESGAVIGEEEAAEEYRTYFPMPGDSQAVKDQKGRARKTAEKAMREATGPKGNRKPEKESTSNLSDEDLISKYM